MLFGHIPTEVTLFFIIEINWASQKKNSSSSEPNIWNKQWQKDP